MNNFVWHFNKRRRSSKRREPIQGEFFATDAISNPGEALIREGIQNSLDARQEGEKVLVRIRASGTDSAIPRQRVNDYIDGLDIHLRAEGNGLRDIPEDGEDCPILVFEDFGTKGLLGDPADSDPPPKSQNHFYHFFRAEGRSDKSEKDIGRWGVGKQVFPRASRINTIFGLTVRNDDKRKLLMGMSVMKSHNIGDQKFEPDGWMGQIEEDDDIFVMPIEDDEYVNKFEDTFDIQRGDAPGLTIVVPWADLELTDENLVKAVLRGYFWPILQDHLEVIVETNKIQTVLDINSIEEEILKIGSDIGTEILPYIELAKWAQAIDESEIIVFNTQSSDRSWTWSRELLPEECLDEIHNKYEKGEMLALRVPVVIREKTKDPRVSHFDIFMFRDGSEQSGRPIFIREGIIIPDVRAPRTRGVRAIVNVEDSPIAAFLGDSENPAHTQWQHDGANFRGKYLSGKSDLDFVKQAVHKIVNIICEQDKKEDRTLLMDLFSIPSAQDDEKTKTRNKKKPTDKSKDTDVTPPPPPPPPAPRPFLVDRIKGGFVVSSNKENDIYPEGLLITAAYHVRRGNPFKKYNSEDFNFNKTLHTHITGASVIEIGGNSLKAKIDKRDFRVEITGFDPNRDVRVEVRLAEINDAG